MVVQKYMHTKECELVVKITKRHPYICFNQVGNCLEETSFTFLLHIKLHHKAGPSLDSTSLNNNNNIYIWQISIDDVIKFTFSESLLSVDLGCQHNNLNVKCFC